MFADLVKRLFRLLGLEVQRLRGANTSEAVLTNLLRRTNPAAVLDVGANTGQFAVSIRKLGFDRLIVSFEALPAVHARLLARARRDPNWLVAPCAALGSAHGSAVINVTTNSASSSLLPMRALHTAAAPESAVVAQVPVRIARLDDLCGSMLPPAGDLFLKVDTQGYEMEVLKGASRLLDRVSAMQLELSLVPLYDRSPTLMEMLAFTEALGFQLFSLAPVFKDPRDGRLLQVDGFFVRGNSSGCG
jgi:FkbM family methyltransferase